MSALDLDTQAAAAIDALAGMGARFGSSDILETRDAVAVGSTRFQLSVRLGAESNRSSERYEVAVVTVRVHRRLTNDAEERTYRLGDMLTHQAAILAPSFWLGMASVFDIASPPVLNEDVDRVGMLVSYAIQTQVELA